MLIPLICKEYPTIKKLNSQKGKGKNINRQFNEDYIGILDKCSILIECKIMHLR